jgi:hypothetical protein
MYKHRLCTGIYLYIYYLIIDFVAFQDQFQD